MYSPENSEQSSFRGHEITPENPMAELIAVERRERQRIFTDLRQEIVRLESLGMDNPSRQSYHNDFLGGYERQVSLRNFMKAGIGRCTRIIVNDEEMGKQDGSTIFIRDFCVAYTRNDLTLLETTTTRDPRNGRVAIGAITGPVLFQRSDYVQVINGHDYPDIYPYEDRPQDYLDVLDRRVAAETLLGILSELNEGKTLKRGFYLQNHPDED